MGTLSLAFLINIVCNTLDCQTWICALRHNLHDQVLLAWPYQQNPWCGHSNTDQKGILLAQLVLVRKMVQLSWHGVGHAFFWHRLGHHQRTLLTLLCWHSSSGRGSVMQPGPRTDRSYMEERLAINTESAYTQLLVHCKQKNVFFVPWISIGFRSGSMERLPWISVVYERGPLHP